MFSKIVRVITSVFILVTVYNPIFWQHGYASVLPTQDYDLSITKTVIDTDLTWGTITYRINYSLSWWVSATWVYLRDMYDSWLSYNSIVSSSPDLTNPSIISTHISDQYTLQWQNISLPEDWSGEVILRFDIEDDSYLSGIINIVSCGVSDDSCRPDNAITWSGWSNSIIFVQPGVTGPSPSPAPYDLIVSKIASTWIVVPWDFIEYTIEYGYHSDTATWPKSDIYLVDNFPKELIFDSVVSGPSPDAILNWSNQIIWRDLSLSPNSSWAIVLRFEVNNVYTGFINYTTIWSTRTDGQLYFQWWASGEIDYVWDDIPWANNTSQVSVDTPPFDLSINKQLVEVNGLPYTWGTLQSGDILKYIITYYNSWYARDDISILDNFSNNNATDFVSTDIPYTFLHPSPYYGAYGTPAYWSKTILWNDLSLPANTTWTIELVLKVKDISLCNPVYVNNAHISLTYNDAFLPFSLSPWTYTWNLTLRQRTPNNGPFTKEANNTNNSISITSPIEYTSWCTPWKTFDLEFDSKTHDDDDGIVYPWQEIEYTLNYSNHWPAHGVIYIDDTFPDYLEYLWPVSTWHILSVLDSPFWDYRNSGMIISNVNIINTKVDNMTESDYLTNIPDETNRKWANGINHNSWYFWLPWNLDIWVDGSVKLYCFTQSPVVYEYQRDIINTASQTYIDTYNYYIWLWYDKRDAYVLAIDQTNIAIASQLDTYNYTDLRNSISTCVQSWFQQMYIDQWYSMPSAIAQATIDTINFINRFAIQSYKNYIWASAKAWLPYQFMSLWNSYSAPYGSYRAVNSYYYQHNGDNPLYSRLYRKPWYYNNPTTSYILWYQNTDTLKTSIAVFDLIKIWSFGQLFWDADNSFSAILENIYSNNSYIDFDNHNPDQKIYKTQNLYRDTMLDFRYMIFDANTEQPLNLFAIYNYQQAVALLSSSYQDGNRYYINSGQYIYIWSPLPTIYSNYISGTSWVSFHNLYMTQDSSNSITLRFRVKTTTPPGTNITNIGNIATMTHFWNYPTTNLSGGTACLNPNNTWLYVWGPYTWRNYWNYIYQSCDGSNTWVLFYWRDWNDINGTIWYFTWETIPWPNNTWDATVIVTWTNPIDLSVTNTITWPTTFDPWDTVTYDISYCNDWVDAQSWVMVQYEYDLWLNYISSTLPIYNSYPSLRRIDFGQFNLAPDTCATGTITFQISSWVMTSLHTTAKIWFLYPSPWMPYIAWPWDTIPSNNTDLMPITINLPPSLPVYIYSWSKSWTWSFTTWSIVTYTISWNNPSTQTWYFTLVEDYGTGLIFVWFTGAVASWLELSNRYHDLTWTKLTLDPYIMWPNSTWSLQIEFEIYTWLAVYDQITNDFTYNYYYFSGLNNCMNGDIDTGNNFSTVIGTYVDESFDLSIDKSIISPTSGIISSGESVTYQLAYHLSWSDRDDIQVEDTLPVWLIFDPINTATWYIISWSTIIWSWLSLSGYTTGTLTISAIYDGMVDDLLINTAIVWTTDNIYDGFTWEIDTGNNIDQEWITPIPYVATCDMSIIKTTDVSTWTIWTLVWYTLVYQNNGPDTCEDVQAQDIRPIELDYISSDPAPISTWSIITRDIWDVLVSSSGVIYITWVINSGAQPYQIIYNTWVVTTSTPETNTGNNTWYTNSPVTWLDIGIEKSVNSGVVYSGENVTWTLYYYNNSLFDAIWVVIYDVLPPTLEHISSTPSYDIFSWSDTYIRNIWNLWAWSDGYITITTKVLTTWSHLNLTVIDREGTWEYTWNNSDIEIVTGLVVPNSISGKVYHDINNNGVYDVWDIILPNVTVTVVDQSGNTYIDTTDLDGNYYISSLLNGIYQVTYGIPSWYNPSVANTWSTSGTSLSGILLIYNITLDWDVHSIANNFWLVQTPSSSSSSSSSSSTSSSSSFGWGWWVPTTPYPEPDPEPPRRVIDIIKDIIHIPTPSIEVDDVFIPNIIPKTWVEILYCIY